MKLPYSTPRLLLVCRSVTEKMVFLWTPLARYTMKWVLKWGQNGTRPKLRNKVHASHPLTPGLQRGLEGAWGRANSPPPVPLICGDRLRKLCHARYSGLSKGRKLEKVVNGILNVVKILPATVFVQSVVCYPATPSLVLERPRSSRFMLATFPVLRAWRSSVFSHDYMNRDRDRHRKIEDRHSSIYFHIYRHYILPTSIVIEHKSRVCSVG